MGYTCLKNESIDKYTSFKIGGKASRLYLPSSKNDFFNIFQEIEDSKEGYEILGRGSNVLISSQGINGNLIITKDLNNIKINKNTIEVEGGCYLPALAKECLKNNLTGMEFLVGIPGSLGGAIYMNASANGQCISDYLEKVEVFEVKTKKFITYLKEELQFGYRKSDIHKNEIVVCATFKLPEEKQEIIRAKMDLFLNFRITKQPKGFNAGSVFKNPKTQKRLSSGYLLDQSGVKGLQVGGAEVSQQHANFINNTSKATSTDISKLMYKMHKSVKDSFGLNLKPEIKYIGKPTKEEENIWKILKAQ